MSVFLPHCIRKRYLTVSEEKSKRDLVITLGVVLYFVAIAVVCLRGVLFSPGVISGSDASIPPGQDQIVKGFESYKYVWFHIQNLAGSEQLQMQKAMINFYTPLYILAKAGLTGATISKLLMLFLLAISGLSSYLLLRLFKMSRFSSLITATVYMLTPIVFDLAVLGGFGIELVVYAILPLTFYLFIKSVSSRTWLKYSILTVFSFLFSPKILVAGAIMLISYSAFRILTSANKRVSLKLYLRSLAIITLLFIPLQAYWTISILVQPLQASGGVPFNLGTVTPIAVGDFIRLLGFWAPFLELTVLPNNFLLIVVSFLPPLVAFGSLLFSRRDENTVFFSIFAVILTAVATSSTLAHLISTNFLSFMGYFRDFTTLYTLLAFSYLVLVGITIDKVYKWAVSINNPIKKTIVGNMKPIATVGVILVLTTIYVSPFLSGDLKGNLKTLDFPNEYDKASNWVNDQDGVFKVLWLPTGSGYVYESGSNVSWHSDYYSLFSPKPGGFQDVNYRYHFISEHWLEDLLYENGPDSLGRVLGLYGIKFIVLRTDSEITQWAAVSSGKVWERKTEMISSNLKQQGDLKQIGQIGGIWIFENEDNSPIVYATNSANVVVGDLSSLLSLSNSGFDFQNQTLIFASQQSKPQAIKLADRIVTQNDNQPIDIMVPFLPAECVIDPGRYVHTPEIEGEWSNLHHLYWWYDTDYQAALEDCAFTKGNNATLNIPFHVGETGEYVVWVKAYQGERNGRILFRLGDSTVKEVDMHSQTSGGYVWEELGVFELNKGLNTLEMSSNTESVVARLIIAPKPQFDDALAEVDRLLESKNTIALPNLLSETSGESYATSVPELEFTELDPTKYQVRIKAEKPFVLVFSESYDDGWKAYVNSQGGETNWVEAFLHKSIPSENHFIVNGYANAWYVDPAELGVGGEFSITLYYKPQSLFYLGLIISGLTLAGCIGVIAWVWRRGSRPKKRE